MNILAFDTCFGACSACVARGGDGGVEVLASALERFETGHAERLVPMIDEVMARAGMAFGDLDRIAVTAGPGTFTGTRIGIAAARGLALATGVAVVGASSLAVMAEVATRELGSRAADQNFVIAVDARRGEVYAQVFGADARDALSPPLLLPVEEAAQLGRGDALLVVGSGAPAVAEAATRAGRRATPHLAGLLPEASALAAMAAGLSPGESPVAPLYLRPPDAKPQDGKSIARAPR
ncbi:MAG TPA: tRNA (adenosine(37)-N6)-threonylcarbamoyltransferase complex dimerization subunit type 1 TsaB [Hyphomicrobium sp.]